MPPINKATATTASTQGSAIEVLLWVLLEVSVASSKGCVSVAVGGGGARLMTFDSVGHEGEYSTLDYFMFILFDF